MVLLLVLLQLKHNVGDYSCDYSIILLIYSRESGLIRVRIVPIVLALATALAILLRVSTHRVYNPTNA